MHAPSSQILKDCIMFRLLELFNKNYSVCATSVYWKEDEMGIIYFDKEEMSIMLARYCQQQM
jgi:hypothetical protein